MHVPRNDQKIELADSLQARFESKSDASLQRILAMNQKSIDQFSLENSVIRNILSQRQKAGTKRIPTGRTAVRPLSASPKKRKHTKLAATAPNNAALEAMKNGNMIESLSLTPETFAMVGRRGLGFRSIEQLTACSQQDVRTRLHMLFHFQKTGKLLTQSDREVGEQQTDNIYEPRIAEIIKDLERAMAEHIPTLEFKAPVS